VFTYGAATYPGDGLASTINVGGVNFNLGPAINTDNNVVSAVGQTIPLPHQTGGTLHILASAVNNQPNQSFLVNYALGTDNIPVSISDWSSSPQYGENVALAFDHRHVVPIGDDFDTTPNIYEYNIPVDNDKGYTQSITLPNNSNVKVFAITLSEDLGVSPTYAPTLTPTVTVTLSTTPTGTITVNPSRTSVPTHTPGPSHTPVPTYTTMPIITNTFGPSHTPVPSNTPVVSTTPQALVTVTPSVSETPTNTTIPGVTDTPVITAAASLTPTPVSPTHTSVPTVIPTHTPVPRPTNTPIHHTSTPVPTHTVTPTPNVPTATPLVTDTPTVTETVTPSDGVRDTPTPIDCSVDSSIDACQVDVVITNVITTKIDSSTESICWDTNLQTQGLINYGTDVEGVTAHSTALEDSYRINHCQNVTDVVLNQVYNFKITARSYAGKQGTHDGTFIITEDLPPTGSTPTPNPIIDPIMQTVEGAATNLFGTEGRTSSTFVGTAVAGSAASILLAASSYPNVLYYGILWFKFPRKKKAWGLVYDNVTRKPLPFMVVRIFNYDTNAYIKQTVSDVRGRYGFVLDAGRYNLKVENSGYVDFIKGFRIDNKEDVVSFDIPLDKKESKVGIQKLKENLPLYLSKISTVIFFVGMTLTVVAFALTPSYFNFVIILLYAIQGLILLLFRSPRNWGYVYERATGERMPGVFIRLYDEKQGRQIDVQIADERGRFGFLEDDGSYLLKVDKPGYVFTGEDSKLESVQIGKEKFIRINTKNLKDCQIALDIS
jgi:hypothetical protein